KAGSDVTDPDHVRGICDIVDCDGVACHAFCDDEAELYVEVCDEHVSSFDGFDSDYERVEHDSPHRSPREVETHDCGGTLHVYDVPSDGDGADAEHRVCTDCGYALLILDGDGDGFEVRHSAPTR
ncbi:MAG: hypothetical protein ACLFSW_06775, partial [Halobacteriales archaeon]